MARIFIYHLTDDSVASVEATHLVEGTTWQVDNKWSVRSDSAHVPGQKDHIHIRLRGKDVSVINSDGSSSHGTNANSVPSWLMAKVKERGLVEGQLLVEAPEQDSVPAEVIFDALRHEISVEATIALINRMRRSASKIPGPPRS